MNVADELLKVADQQGDRCAIVQPARSLWPGVPVSDRVMITFGELERESARLVRLLRDVGVGGGDHVLVLVGMSIQLYIVLIACFRIGAVATFPDAWGGLETIARCCQLAQPRAMVGAGGAHLLRLVVNGLRKIPRKIVFGLSVPGACRWRPDMRPCRGIGLAGGVRGTMSQSPPGGNASSRFFPEHPTACEDQAPALLTFTSGSTGVPKPIIRSHALLLAQHRALVPALGLQPGQVDLTAMPMFVLANLASGVTSVIPDADLRLPESVRPAPLLRQIEQERISRCIASPALLDRLLGTFNGSPAPGPLTTLQHIHTGGGPVFPGLLEHLHRLCSDRATAIYGSTEAEPIAHLSWDEVSKDDRQRMASGAGILAGRPVPEISIRIVEDEILVSGNHVVSHCVAGSGAEAAKVRMDGRIWHRTGDSGYMDGSGRLWLLGRLEGRVEDDGGVIYPFAAEAAASLVSGVRRSALIPLRGQRALVVEAPNACKAALQRAVEPLGIRLIVKIRRIPVDRRHNAKIDYRALRRCIATA
jgi:olefin beta-lactone synthetase